MGGAQSSEQGQYGFHVLKASKETFQLSTSFSYASSFLIGIGQGEFTSLSCRN